MKYKSIYFVTHEAIKNLGEFRNYLIDNSERLVTFHFPHGYLHKSSYVEVYENGRLTQRREFYRYGGGSSLVKLIFYYIYFNYTLFRFVDRGSYVLVENPIYCIFNTVPSVIKQVKFIYWIGDYYPQNTGFMWFYNKLVDFYNEKLNYVLYESPPISNIYKSKLKKQIKSYRVRKMVTLGMKKEFTEQKLRPNNILKLGFMGVIRFQQGLDLVFDYLKSNSDCQLEIVGSGYKLEYYKKLAKEMGIDKKVKFYGFVENVEPILKKWDIGLALYENTRDNVSMYCEPTKIKDYLEHGLPVITTKTTYFRKEVKKYKLGEVIEETTDSLRMAIDKVKKDYPIYQEGVLRILKDYDYNKWYDDKFSFMREGS